MPTCSHPGPNGYQVITAVNGRYEHTIVANATLLHVYGCFTPGTQLNGISVRYII